MAVVALKRVNLVNPMGDVGDRLSLAMSTCIANDEWLIEADYHYGTVGDINLYRNINVNTKGSIPDWQWYAAIPTANIKAYTLSNPPPPSTVVTNEPQAETSQKKVSAVSAAE